MSALETGVVDHSNPERLGTIARVPQPQQAATTPAASGAASPQPLALPHDPSAYAPPVFPATSPASANSQFPIANPHVAAPALDHQAVASSVYPGTLNIIIHRGRNVLNLASSSEPHDLYVELTNLQSSVTFKSEADPQGGPNPVWFGNPHIPLCIHHFPFSVQQPTQQIQIDLKQKNAGTFGFKEDKLIGSALFYVENLRANSALQWYPLALQNMQVGFLLIQTQYIALHAGGTMGNGGGSDSGAMLTPQQQQALQANAPQYPSSAQAQQQFSAAQTTPHHAGYDYVGKGRNSLSDRVKGLFHEPTSPDHTLGVGLSDLHRREQHPNASFSDHPPASAPGLTSQASRDEGVGRMAVVGNSGPHPSTSLHAGVGSYSDQPGFLGSTSTTVSPEMGAGAGAGAASSSAAAAGGAEEEVNLDFPDVPQHQPSSAGKPPKRNSSSGASGNSASNDGGGTLLLQRPKPNAAPKKKSTDEDADLEARFRALQ